ncbi:hypothetical protein ACP6PL_07635, partial [Dapis sp. BLCC M126]|uniref:hypothetical protein n=1 Tax=Dapis sp. BLCC M126 TaxID=3400189 RepID=UPI003CF59D29
PLTLTPYPINQESGRLRSSPLGWDAEETSAYPIDQEKRNDISQSSILSVLTRGNYQLSIINYQLMNHKP